MATGYRPNTAPGRICYASSVLQALSACSAFWAMVSQPQSSARASSNQAKPYVIVAKIINVLRESQRVETVLVDNFTKALGFSNHARRNVAYARRHLHAASVSNMGDNRERPRHDLGYCRNFWRQHARAQSAHE